MTFREVPRDEAHTAYGALEKVPGDLDMLIAGTSCVDFSKDELRHSPHSFPAKPVELLRSCIAPLLHKEENVCFVTQHV